MAKEIIDRIKEAESESLKMINDAKARAKEIKAESRKEASGYRDGLICAANENSEKEKNEALNEAEKLIRKAEEEAEARKKELRDSLSGKMEETCEQIIGSLIK